MREHDTLKVELLEPVRGAAGVLENFTSFEIAFDMEAPTEANFELGDDGSYAEIGELIRPGAQYRVTLNDTGIMEGRVEASDIPQDVRAGSTLRFAVRTRISQAGFGSARPISVVKSTLDRFIFGLYAQIGMTESDFIVKASLARELLTGRSVRMMRGNNDEVRLNKLNLDEARVRVPETIFQAADRHLRRFGLMHWDGPDGRIVIGAPDDEQDPSYTFHSYRNEMRVLNNTLGSTRRVDYSGVPSFVGVYGVGGGKDTSRARVAGFAFDQDVIDSGLVHPVSIVADSIKNQAAAENAAQRELTMRRRNKDSITLSCDGLSYWDVDMERRIPFSLNTTATVGSDAAGGDLGLYFLQAFRLRRDPETGDTSTLSLARQGAWKLASDQFAGAL